MTQPLDGNGAKDVRTVTVSPADNWLQTVKTLVASLGYGSVQIVIQDARVVQIESTEKIRFDHPPSKSAGDSARRRTAY